MKVKELYIKKYHQFEDFHLNLTYPEGHPKAGQPLDKVCFIGQSGTGKTSLIEIIEEYIKDHSSTKFSKEIINSSPRIFGKTNRFLKGSEGFYYITFQENIKASKYNENISVNCIIANNNKNIEEIFLTSRIINNKSTSNNTDNLRGNTNSKSRIDLINDRMIINHEVMRHYQETVNNDNIEEYFKVINKIKPLLIYYPCDIELPKEKRFMSDKFSSETINYLRTNHFYSGLNNSDNETIIDFSLKSSNGWGKIKEEIKKYREQEIKKSLEIVEITRRSNFKPSDIVNASDDFKKWLDENPNPVKELADNYLDKILNKFNLKVKTELDFEKTEDIETIKIQQKNGKEIPFEALSTGTKQVILTALPLYSLKPKNSIILFDEPERSLYPDIQAEIVDFYTSMASECQFFFATHSPLVASSFEPWEIVELKFNTETGNVYQELYYDPNKGRHVDNYTIDPRYLRWDGILKKVFDLDKEGNDMRVSELVNLATLEIQLKNNNLSIEQKKEKFEEYKKLANLLNWDLN